MYPLGGTAWQASLQATPGPRPPKARASFFGEAPAYAGGVLTVTLVPPDGSGTVT